MDEEHFAVLGEGPEFVIDDEFQVIDMITDLFDEGRYGVVIGDGPLAAVLDAICHPACFDKAFHILDDEGVILLYCCPLKFWSFIKLG